MFCFFFLTVIPTTAIYTLSLHDALPIFAAGAARGRAQLGAAVPPAGRRAESDAARARAGTARGGRGRGPPRRRRSEEHTSELQSHVNLVCRLLLEKKKDIR